MLYEFLNLLYEIYLKRVKSGSSFSYDMIKMCIWYLDLCDIQAESGMHQISKFFTNFAAYPDQDTPPGHSQPLSPNGSDIVRDTPLPLENTNVFNERGSQGSAPTITNPKDDISEGLKAWTAEQWS